MSAMFDLIWNSNRVNTPKTSCHLPDTKLNPGIAQIDLSWLFSESSSPLKAIEILFPNPSVQKHICFVWIEFQFICLHPDDYCHLTSIQDTDKFPKDRWKREIIIFTYWWQWSPNILILSQQFCINMEGDIYSCSPVFPGLNTFLLSSLPETDFKERLELW